MKQFLTLAEKASILGAAGLLAACSASPIAYPKQEVAYPRSELAYPAQEVASPQETSIPAEIDEDQIYFDPS
jgi:hypothetical protein